ncbi:MAG: 3-oxoadipate enol-lactonase [Corynebacterium casei]|uniref:3-oxoadipate enol-lactonase n=1 Tax=Corynebacterium casei TaxID=160386 RepID=UPI002649672C|nr:3-oxoadipate enol-lactonase [Corynebacterium casei]MDN5800549.1 3-oxoadipate enol-lactonase [Corynebacterium casei]MDN5841649.1 3-oxoadipate enol-lactonase [Corynebacterium casei]MDN5921738.1 3-oxoadipate enol-lactonase [Corynebacterium casei]MDN6263042.1 3-oxoadipate enol-lactonase [Corynebacterium casei]MDN6273464.1 3-oxoadipate enol-lactonase [Corynebacterium casei]
MAQLHFVEYGPRKAEQPQGTLMFIGSIGSTTDIWLPQLDALSDSFRVIAVDHRGHGLSPVVESPASIADLASDVQETIGKLGVNAYGVVGLSLGGAVAQYLAANDPKVTSAALLCTAPKFGTPDSWHERARTVRADSTAALADAIVARWFSEGWIAENPASTAFYREMIATTPAGGYASCSEALADWDFADQLSSITVPTLVLAGADDPATPPEVLKEIGDKVSGESTYVEISPGAHVPTIEAPKEVTDALRAHFSKY